MRPYFLLASALLTAGCAGETEMRQVAGRSGAVLTQYRAALGEFVAGQSAINAANESRLEQLRMLAQDRRGEIATRVTTWRLSGNEAALRRFQVVSESGSDDALAAAGPAPVRPTPAELKFDSKEVDAVIKSLVDLQKPVDAQQRLETLIAFSKPILQTLETDTGVATEKAGDSTGKAATALNTVLNGAASGEAEPQ